MESHGRRGAISRVSEPARNERKLMQRLAHLAGRAGPQHRALEARLGLWRRARVWEVGLGEDGVEPVGHVWPGDARDEGGEQFRQVGDDGPRALGARTEEEGAQEARAEDCDEGLNGRLERGGVARVGEQRNLESVDAHNGQLTKNSAAVLSEKRSCAPRPMMPRFM